MLKIWELIPINKDDEFTYYLTNREDYQGMIKISNEKVDNFEGAVKAGRIDSDKWRGRDYVKSYKWW